jgi:putative membrane protein
MEEAVVRYLHFIGIILLASMLIAENILLSSPLKVGAIKKLVKIDGYYAIGAVITLGAGMFLWLIVGKPKAFYSTNIIFHIKLGLFLLIAFLSIFPTVFLVKNLKNEIGSIVVPNRIIFIKRFELALLCFIPLLATIMARGLGSA